MQMTKNGQVPLVRAGFDYSSIDRRAADRARCAAVRIRDRVKKTLEDIIEVGTDLCRIKAIVPHGAFGLWLRAEFGWTERTARNFMAVADWFGPKTEMISELAIVPTAAYLLAAPSVPDEARRVAIERAQAGQKITMEVAREITADFRKKHRHISLLLPGDHLAPRLERVLERYKERWKPDELSELACQLHQFADRLACQA